MTSNQIALRNVKNEEAKLEEEKRHNLVTEAYTSEHYVRQDKASLMQAEAATSQAETAQKQLFINQINAETQRYQAETGRLSYIESARHNVATENVAYQQLEEQQRHNLVGEAQQWTSLAETKRHNTETESQQWFALQETQRHNQMQESQQWFNLSEVQRHNLTTELLSNKQIDESIRHNLAAESENYRHNLAGETLTQKQIEESKRHNTETEKVSYLQANTAQYAATTQRTLGWANLGETIAHNAASDAILKEKNRIQDAYNTGRLELEKQRLKQGGKQATTLYPGYTTDNDTQNVNVYVNDEPGVIDKLGNAVFDTANDVLDTIVNFFTN